MEKILIRLLGHPRIELPDGTSVIIPSKKGMALLALLATAETAERSRAWIQQKLWGSRQVAQAQASLRRELSNLRMLSPIKTELVKSDKLSVRLNLDAVDVDTRNLGTGAYSGEFLEGIDIHGEDDFEDWLRQTRASFQDLKVPKPDLPDNRKTVRSQGIFKAGDTGFQNILAILPVNGLFLNASDEPLLLGVTRLLVNGVARLRWLPVIAPETMHDERFMRYSTRDVANELKARYVLQSELVRSHDSTALTFTLVEMPNHVVLWSDTEAIAPALDLADIERVLHRAISLLAASVDYAEQARAMADVHTREELANLPCRIRYHLQKFTREDMQIAADYLEQAHDHQPFHKELVMLKAHHAIWTHWLKRLPVDQSQYLIPYARAAVRADPADARGPLFMGVLESWQRNTASAVRFLTKSCELNPSFPSAFVHLGAAYYLNGEPERAIKPLEQALYLSPLDPFRFFALGELATARFLLGDYEVALKLAQEVQITNPNYVLSHILETGALVKLGRITDAQSAWDRMLGKRHDLYEGMLSWIPFKDRYWMNRLREDCDFVAASHNANQLAAIR